MLVKSIAIATALCSAASVLSMPLESPCSSPTPHVKHTPRGIAPSYGLGPPIGHHTPRARALNARDDIYSFHPIEYPEYYTPTTEETPCPETETPTPYETGSVESHHPVETHYTYTLETPHVEDPHSDGLYSIDTHETSPTQTHTPETQASYTPRPFAISHALEPATHATVPPPKAHDLDKTHQNQLEARQANTICPGDNTSNPLCCQTDALGVAALDCQGPADASTIRLFRDSCETTNRDARCCSIPVAGQAALCIDPPGFAPVVPPGAAGA